MEWVNDKVERVVSNAFDAPWDQPSPCGYGEARKAHHRMSEKP